MILFDIVHGTRDADEQTYPIRGCRFIAHIADVSAFVGLTHIEMKHFIRITDSLQKGSTILQ